MSVHLVLSCMLQRLVTTWLGSAVRCTLEGGQALACSEAIRQDASVTASLTRHDVLHVLLSDGFGRAVAAVYSR